MADLVPSSRWQGPAPRWRATVAVAIGQSDCTTTDLGTVYGSWSDGANVLAEIESGIAVFHRFFQTESATFFITSMSHPSCSYAFAQNQETSVTILPPPT